MPYSRYQKTREGNEYRYVFKENASLFGCNNGYIPYFLRKQLDSESTEPLEWKLNMEESFRKGNMADSVVVIDLRPNTNLSLYEVVNVFGYSAAGWTPIMLHLRGLFIDEDRQSYDEKDFIRKEEEIDDPIFTMMYLTGTVKQGEIVDTWNLPPPAAANAALLWPDTLRYFYSEAQKIMAAASG